MTAFPSTTSSTTHPAIRRGPSAAATLLALVALPIPAAADELQVPSDLYPTIQSAVDAAAPGDVLVVKPAPDGVYVENVLITTPDLELIGKRAVVDAHVKGAGFTVHAEGQPVDGVTIHGFTIRNAPGDGIQAVGDGLSFTRNTIEGCLGDGIDVIGDDLTVFANRLAMLGGSGVRHVSPTGTGLATLERNDASGNAGDGLRLSGGNLRVERNRLADNGARGLRLDDGAGAAGAGAIVLRNRIGGNGAGGVLATLSGPATLTLERNRIADGGGDGIALQTASGAVLERNLVCRNAGNGVWLDAQACRIEDNRVERNTRDGIRVESAGVACLHELVDNTVRRNGRDGIGVLGGGNRLEGNRCLQNLGDGIDVHAADPGDSVGNLLTGNRCLRNGHEGIDNSGTATTITDNIARLNGPGGNGPDIAGTGNTAFPGDPAGIGSVAVGGFSDNHTSDASADDPGLPQVLDLP